MPRKGRSRKAGKRERNGRIQRAPLAARADQERQTVLDQPHRRHFPKDKRRSQNLEDELGRMYEAGLLFRKGANADEAEILLAAGRRYQRLMVAFHQVMASPIPNKSAGFSYVAERVEADPDHDPLAHLAATESPEDRHQRICWEVERVNRIFRLLPPSEAHFQRGALDSVCLLDRGIASRDRHGLHDALFALAWAWRMFPVKQVREYAYRTERPLWDDSTDVVRLRVLEG